MKTEIRNGRVIDPANGIDARQPLYIVDGRIAGVGNAPAGFVAERSIDAAGLVVCPGLVDLSARVGSSSSELRAAVAGGITSLCCPPDTNPPLDEPGLVEILARHAETLRLAHVHPVGALTVGLRGEVLAEMAKLTAAGCVAFSQASTAIADTQILYRALQYASTFDYAIWLRAQDPFLAAGGVAHDGEIAARLGLPGIPTCAETIALQTLIELARETGAHLHINRLSSAAGVELIRAARASGVAVSADVAVHHLHLSEQDIGFFDSLARLDPPLRSESDRQALCRGLAEGAIQAVCSDHTPVDADGKQMPFAEAKAGASSLELLLPLTLQWALTAGVPLADALRRVTSEPARIARIAAGTFTVGAVADVCLFDPEARWTIGSDTLRSRGHNTPFNGRSVVGQVRQTLVAGEVVFAA